jgi:DNA-binding beta-propeller fold protein YncE
MKWRKESISILLAAALACLWAAACGGGSSAGNQVVVTVIGQFSVMIPTQTQTITASVTGATDVSSTFTCNYTTTPDPTTAVPNPKPSASASCESKNGLVGVLSNVQNTSTTVASTATFTAPQKFPDQGTLPNVLVTITATSHADPKKTGTFNISFDSGIRITVTPATSTVATVGTQQFFAKDFNGNVIANTDLTWGVTFESTAKTSSVSCSGGSNDCGSMAVVAGIETYTAPANVPTAAPASTTTPVNAAGIVTVFAFSTIDKARIAQAAVTIVKAGNIAFTGISPAVAPQGGFQQDIFLAATNATSQIGITLSPADSACNVTGTGPTIDPTTQVKVIFAPGASASSLGARLRLNQAQLVTAGHFNIKVTSSNPTIKVTPPGDAGFCMDIVPARPGIVSTSPDNFQEATLGQTGGVPFVIDGGLFGAPSSPTVTPRVNGQSLLANTNQDPRFALVPSARRIGGSLPPSLGSSANAGLFPVSVTYSAIPGPFSPPASTTAFSNIAVIPNYGGSNAATSLSTISLPNTSVPSAIAVDSVLGYAVVTLGGVNTPGSNSNTQNNVQFVNLNSGTPALAGTASSGGNLATGVAVDDHLHVAAVINYASRSLSVLSIPSGTLLGTVDLSGVIPPPETTSTTFVQPFPYSVGIDPFSHRALVAFASTNVGLVINLDPGVTPTCLAITPQSTYCAISYVTLNSGTNPQIAFEAGAHLAYVTPGGAGVLSAVDLGNVNPAKDTVGITSATRASNIVTVTTAATHNLTPGNPGTVLIAGLPKGSTSSTNFNGSFSVGQVLDGTHFQYFQADKDDTSTCPPPTPPSTILGCTASSGTAFLTFSISPSIQGIAINPVSRQAVLADPKAASSQITFIDPQSQSVTSMSLFQGVTGAVLTGVPELGATNVAFQPFSNTAVSFNPNRNEVSLLDPSLLQRPAILSTSTGQNGIGQVTLCTASCGSATPTTISLTIPGALAVDSMNNLALVLNSGSDNISVFKLGSIKSVHIERVETPAIDATGISTPANLASAVKITLGAAPAAIGPVKILGSGFTAGPMKIELDGVDVAGRGATVSANGNQELDVTFPAGFFTGPRHFALTVVNGAGVTSNVADFTVLEEVLIPGCGTAAPLTAAAPGGVAIDEVHSLALITNTGAGCNQVSVISLNPANIFSQTVKSIATGATPTAVAVLPRLAYTGQPASTSGVAVVTNNTANTVSIIDPVNLKTLGDVSITDVAVGTAPSGVAIDQETNLAVIANTNSNSVSTIDLTPLTASPIGKLTATPVAVDQNPIAVAIDPDRGTSGRGIAVVACLILNGSSSAFGALDVVDIGGTTPVKSASASLSGIQATPTGVVFDPTGVSGTTNPGLFYAVSSEGNQVTTFNPDNSQTRTIPVGINPTALASNFQTGTILTVNSLSNTISVLDSQTLRTKKTMGIGAKSNFSAAIQTFTNLAVIADQANNRVLLFPLPN